MDAKTMSHKKDNKFGGKDGGAGWNIFLEDMMVIMGSVDSELEQGALEITDLKKKQYDEKEGIRGYLDPELYAKYSGELYAKLMEVTKEDAQKLVRNGGMKNGWRCGFRALRDLAERYNPKSYMKRLKMLLGVIKPAEAKSVKDVQAAVDEWGARLLRLKQEYGSEIQEDIKVAILISMVPEGLQEKIFGIEKGMEKIKYGAAREVVITTPLAAPYLIFSIPFSISNIFSCNPSGTIDIKIATLISSWISEPYSCSNLKSRASHSSTTACTSLTLLASAGFITPRSIFRCFM